VHYFPTYFLTQLCQPSVGYNYSAVQKWTLPHKLERIHRKATHLFKDIDLIIIPGNQNNTHWVLLVIDFTKQHIVYLDSRRHKPSREKDKAR